MTYIFDLENVSGKAFTGIENLGENDKIIVFYSQNSKNISIDTHLKIIETKVNKDYIKVRIGGKNALDFQLSSYIGYLFGKNLDEKITIVSGDMGFDFVVDFWKDRGCSIKRKLFIEIVKDIETIVFSTDFSEKVEENGEFSEENEDKMQNIHQNSFDFILKEENILNDIESNISQNEKIIKTTKMTEKSDILTLLEQNFVENPEEIVQIVGKYKTKQGINNALCKKLGSQMAGDVYKIIKPFLADKKGR